jgi:GNAT superfamily N-acetyltransferase
LLGCVALKQHSADMGEIKSMRTAPEARGKGVGRALLQFLLAEARQSGMSKLYLETGSMDFFLPARTLYQAPVFTTVVLLLITPTIPIVCLCAKYWNKAATLWLTI